MTEQESGLRITVEPYDPEPAISATRMALLEHPAVRAVLGDAELSVHNLELSDKDSDRAGFEAVVHNARTCRSAHVSGRVDELESVSVRPSDFLLLASEDEYGQAVELALRDPRIAELVDAHGLTPYRPMPPVLDSPEPDGTRQRVIAVGLRGESGDLAHRIIGVRLADGSVIHEPAGVAHPTSDNCEATPAEGGCEPSAGRDQVRVRVLRGSAVLWDLVVVRPEASSGTNGSGIELRYVDYKGRRVLHRAHVPILNVEYGGAGVRAGCGPTYRDWQNSETCFEAVGSEPVGPGWRLCTIPPQTILDSGHDGGGFRGVALWYHNGGLRLVSQLQAGWYRYISEWHLLDNGTIQPRFGFAAVANPCTCKVHTHHAYWRLDFDIITPGNNVVEEYNNPPIIPGTHWHTKKYEIRRTRDAAHNRHWRVRNKGTFMGYTIQPGPHDGTADAFGAGDLWVLRYHAGEIDDGHGFSTNPYVSRADIDKFLNSESVDGQDVVLWYGGHFVHDQAHPGTGGHIVGPDLVPFNW
ncbi:hypothetical protein RBS60_00495 [Sinomonas sp. ASV486]|uniref:copper amine oxidase n=1 Tax=Sinomonas sp. ASV486 TaxID=3051170 RepID=UPI0027DB6D3A|nr:hypothetical protein [Sinomonas sp. ASV486]MDQ4488670.1 hypothetical protein [Sinomonas sp. ASV486]